MLSMIGALFLRPDAASDLQLLTMAPPNVAAPQRHFVGSAIQVQVKGCVMTHSHMSI
jgi:hypothetical protein